MFKNNRNLTIIALIAIVNALGYGIIIPIMYSYADRFGINDFQKGILFALFSICQFISTPIIGRMSDKYGRKPLLIISISGTVLSFLMMAFAPNALVVYLARALDGITAGNIPVAMAVISDTTELKDRAKGFGIIGASFGFGFVFGPAISALTVGFSQGLPFLIAAIISLIAVIMTAMFLPETNKHLGEVKAGKLIDFHLLWHSLFDEGVGLTFIITLFFYLAFACAIMFGYQPFTRHILHLSDQMVAVLFVVFGIIGLISQSFIVYRITNFLGAKKAFTTSILFTAVSFLIMYFSRSLAIFLLASVILGVANSTVQTLIPTILSEEVDAKSQGSIMGLNTSYQSIGMIFGPILGGFLASFAVPYPLLAGCIIVLFCFALSFNVYKPAKEETAF